jgi:hypothetical protein
LLHTAVFSVYQRLSVVPRFKESYLESAWQSNLSKLWHVWQNIGYNLETMKRNPIFDALVSLSLEFSNTEPTPPYQDQPSAYPIQSDVRKTSRLPKWHFLKLRVEPAPLITCKNFHNSCKCSSHLSEKTDMSSAYDSANLFKGCSICGITQTGVEPLALFQRAF